MMRWIVRSGVALVILALFALVGAVLIPSDRIAALAAQRFTDLTGRALTIEGAVRPSLWPTLGVQTGPVTIANAPWAQEGPMLRAEGLSISLDMAALLQGDVRITGITAKAPDLVLERAADGRANWVFGGVADGSNGTARPGMAGEGTPFTLDLAQIEQGRLRFVDRVSGTDLDLSALTGTVRIPAFEGAADITFSAIHNGQPFDLALNIAQFAPFLEGKVVGLTARLAAGPAEAAFEGRAGWQPLAATGRLQADLGDLQQIARLAGFPAPALPEGLGAGQVAVNGEVTLTAERSLHLRGASLQLDDNRLTVEADLTQGAERPRLSAQVGAGALNLAGAMGGQSGQIGDGARGGVQAAGWPQGEIDVSALGLMDATVAFSAASVDLGVASLGPTRLVVTLDRARAVFELRQVAAYQGSLSGQFVVNGRNGLSVGGDLALSGLAMQPLLADLGGYDRLTGTGDLSLKFLGVGSSVAAIMRSLSGSGQISLGRGELRGLDIAGMLRTLDAGYVGSGQKTIFDAISASFAIADGVLRNDDLRFSAPLLTATGAGTVDLGARRLEYRLRPTALAQADGTGGVMVPLLISGPWADPSFRLDLESIARERLEAEAKALEAEAKAELERRAAEELGIVAQEGESLEDAARRRAQEALEAEAARALERLLGGGN